MRLEGVEKKWVARDGELVVAADALEIAAGDRIAVLGDSGSGKTTLLNLLCLALAPTAAVRFELATRRGGAVDLMRLWRQRQYELLARIRARYFGYVPQTGALLPFLSALENIALPQQLSGRVNKQVIRHLVERLGIAACLDRRPEQLSLGQRQRVAIARALSHRPLIVLADEPTAAVQATLAREIMLLLIERCSELGAALVVATHSPELTEMCQMSYLVPEMIETSRGTRAEFVIAAHAAADEALG